MSTPLQRTALFDEHRRLGARLIDFGGWEMPVQYSGTIDEHQACRQAAALFDVSHMGEVEVSGPGATRFLDALVTNDVSRLTPGVAQYTVMCADSGGIVDDLVIYCRSSGSDGHPRYLVVINASNTPKDVAWMERVAARVRAGEFGACPAFELRNASAEYSQIALQGPRAAEILAPLTDVALGEIATYRFAEGRVAGTPAIVARTGYTGEDGFELYVAWQSGPALWRALLEAGAPHGLKPAGLGARDTLRLEMKYPLYGNELTDETHPLEAGLGWVVKLDKAQSFVGQARLRAHKSGGFERRLVGLKMLERGIARGGYAVGVGEQVVGRVTSGTQSPSLGVAIAIAFVPSQYAAVGSRLWVQVRDTRVAAEVVATPFWRGGSTLAQQATAKA